MKKSTIFCEIIFAGVVLSGCQVGSSAAPAGNPANISLKAPIAAAYITNKNGVSKCLLNSQGQFIACFHAESALGIEKPAGIAINNSSLYVTSYQKSSVLNCNLKGSVIKGCTSAFNVPVHVYGPTSLAFFESYAYVSDASGNSILACTINKDGSLDNCNQTGNSINWANGVAVNGTSAYISNWNTGTVLQCQINTDSGALVDCTPTGGAGSFIGPNQVAFYESYAYVPNSDGDAVSMCQVGGNGALANCKYTGPIIKDLENITIYNSMAFITSSSGVNVCQIDDSGNLSNACELLPADSYGLDKPNQIAIRTLEYDRYQPLVYK